MADKSKCKTQAEVDYINAASAMQIMHDDLRVESDKMAKQIIEMTNCLRLCAKDDTTDGGRIAAKLLTKYNDDQVPF